MRKVRSKPAKTISAVSQGLARYLFCLWCIVQGHSRGIKAIQVCRQWDGGEGLFSDLLHYLSTHSGIIPCLHCVRITGWMEWRRISPNVWWDLPVEWHGVTSVNVLFVIGKCLKYSSPQFHLGWVKNHKTNICKAWEPQFISSDNMHLFSFIVFAGLKSTQGQRRWLHGSWFHFGLTLLSYHAFRGRKASVFTMGLYGIKELINQTRIRKKENLHTLPFSNIFRNKEMR